MSDAAFSAVESFLTDNLTADERAAIDDAVAAAVPAFVAQHLGEGRRIAVVSSGGTSVPLERNAVRFITNFSSGGRGSALVEALVKRDFAVIMLTRSDAIRPFTPRVSLDALMEGLQDGPLPADIEALVADRRRYRKQYLCVPFHSVVEYLYAFRSIAAVLTQRAVSQPLVVLAAAVSDYFMPRAQMAVHKISGGDGLDIHLAPVPKALGVIAHRWLGPTKAYVVSFKLETDEEALVKKAVANMTAYDLPIVVANMLQTYRTEVRIVTRGGEVETLQASGGRSIDECIVERLLRTTEIT